MRVKDVMVSRNLLTVDDSQRLAIAAQRMLWGRLRHLPVLRGNEVVGVISERDILARRGEGDAPSWENTLVGEVMSRPPFVAVPDEEVAQAAALMAAHKIGCLPVVEKGRLVGMLTSTDLVGAAVSEIFTVRAPLQRPVREAMTEDVLSVRADEDIMEAVDLMVVKRIRHLPVVDDKGRVVGVLSDRDVRAGLGEPGEALESWSSRSGHPRVGSVMTRDPIVIRSNAPLSAAVGHLLNRRVGALPVVDEAGRLRGVISYLDVLRHLGREPSLGTPNA